MIYDRVGGLLWTLPCVQGGHHCQSRLSCSCNFYSQTPPVTGACTNNTCRVISLLWWGRPTGSPPGDACRKRCKRPLGASIYIVCQVSTGLSLMRHWRWEQGKVAVWGKGECLLCNCLISHGSIPSGDKSETLHTQSDRSFVQLTRKYCEECLRGKMAALLACSFYWFACSYH